MTDQTTVTVARTAGRYQLDSDLSRRTPAERAARGKAARTQAPRDSHAAFDPPQDRPDPIALLAGAGADASPRTGAGPVRAG